MELSGVGSATASMIANTTSQSSVAMQKKAMDMEKQIGAQLVASIEQSAPKPSSSGAVGGKIDVMV
ncbi:MAG: putative motility protein [Candidatus Thiodiazotropha sp.]|jgi:hypothetical protein